MDIKDTLRQFISAELLEDSEPVGDEENLLADGMIDSLGMLRLVTFIEGMFELKIPPQDFIVQNFRTIAVLESYLQTRMVSDGG